MTAPAVNSRYPDGVRACTSVYQLADTLVVTQPWDATVAAVRDVAGTLARPGATPATQALANQLRFMLRREDRLKVEWRNRETLAAWVGIVDRLASES